MKKLSKTEQIELVKTMATGGETTTAIAAALGINKANFIARKRSNAAMKAAYNDGKFEYARNIGASAEIKNGRVVLSKPKGNADEDKTNENKLNLMEKVKNYLHTTGEGFFEQIQQALAIDDDEALADAFRVLILERREVKARRVGGCGDFKYFINSNVQQTRLNQQTASGIA